MLTVSWAEQDPVAASDRGLAYGDGLFETIRVNGGQPLLLAQHLQRLVAGASRLAIPVTPAELESPIEQALARYSRDGDWVLKLILTRGSGGRGYRPPGACEPRLICSCHSLPPMPPEAGVDVELSSQTLVVNPQLAGMKTLNRLEQVLASAAMGEHAYEAILTDGRRCLVEGTRTNLLLRVGGEWLLPPMSTLAVQGVMLDHILARLRSAGERVTERLIPLSLLRDSRFQGLYLTNSVIGAVPVRSIDGLNLPIDRALATICGPLVSSK